jgi:hypothetical protein
LRYDTAETDQKRKIEMIFDPGSVGDRLEETIRPFGYHVENLSMCGTPLVITVKRDSWDQAAEVAARKAVEEEFPGLVVVDDVILNIIWGVVSDTELFGEDGCATPLAQWPA